MTLHEWVGHPGQQHPETYASHETMNHPHIPYLPEVGYNIPQACLVANCHSCQHLKICCSTWLIDNHLCTLSDQNLSQISDALGAVGETPTGVLYTPPPVVIRSNFFSYYFYSVIAISEGCLLNKIRSTTDNMFFESRNPFLAVSRGYHVRVTSKIQINFRFYMCSEGTDEWVLWIFVIPSLPTFSGSSNPFFIASRSYLVWMTSKIQVNFGFAGPWGYWWLGFMDFRNSSITYVFGGQGIHFS